MKVYFIPGLAADKRVFRHIRLPGDFESCYLDWIPPQNKESLQEYAYRMAMQIDQSQPFILIGLSFGGMLAVEIAKKYPPLQLILIASISDHRHLPKYYRIAYRAGLHRVLGINVIKKVVYVKRYFTNESKDDKNIIRQMARDIDPEFVRWAIRAVVNWQTNEEELAVYHIHGEKDIILPFTINKLQFKIPGAGHLMIFDRAEEINLILKSLLENKKFSWPSGSEY